MHAAIHKNGSSQPESPPPLFLITAKIKTSANLFMKDSRKIYVLKDYGASDWSGREELGAKGEGPVFGGLHDGSFAWSLVVDAAEMQYAVYDDSV